MCDRARGLRLLVKLTLVSKEWRDLIRAVAEHSALRLAQFDLIWEWRAPWISADRYVINRFDAALEMFIVTWALMKPILLRMRILPLGELSVPELSCLRDELSRRWLMKAPLPEGRDWREFEEVWVPPS